MARTGEVPLRLQADPISETKRRRNRRKENMLRYAKKNGRRKVGKRLTLKFRYLDLLENFSFYYYPSSTRLL